MIGVQTAQEQVGIGHGDLVGILPPVAHRSRVRACAFWSHAQRAPGIQAGNRAPTRPDGVDVDHGQTKGQTRDLTFGRLLHAAGTERDVGAGTAHVKGDGLLKAGPARQVKSAYDTPGRTRQGCACGQGASSLSRNAAAIRLHDPQPPSCQPLLQVGEVATR